MRRALLVGINEYGEKSLKGCVADAWRMFNVLSTHGDGSLNFECLLIASQKTDLDAQIQKAKRDDPNSIILKERITAALIKKHLNNLFQEKADVALFYFSGHGTVNNLGGYLVTSDFERFNPGVSMPELITLANNASAEEVVIIIDCCHSGNLGEIPALGNETTILREGVSILTGSASNQSSVEKNGGGLFTKCGLRVSKWGSKGFSWSNYCRKLIYVC